MSHVYFFLHDSVRHEPCLLLLHDSVRSGLDLQGVRRVRHIADLRSGTVARFKLPDDLPVIGQLYLSCRTAIGQTTNVGAMEKPWVHPVNQFFLRLGFPSLFWGGEEVVSFITDEAFAPLADWLQDRPEAACRTWGWNLARAILGNPYREPTATREILVPDHLFQHLGCKSIYLPLNLSLLVDMYRWCVDTPPELRGFLENRIGVGHDLLDIRPAGWYEYAEAMHVSDSVQRAHRGLLLLLGLDGVSDRYLLGELP